MYIYISPFVCGVIVGAVGMLILLVAFSIYFQRKDRH